MVSNVAITSDHYPLYCDFKKPTGLEEYPKAEGDLRIGNYFLTYCKGTDGVIDYDRTGRIIAKMNADIVCLQGLDKETERSEGIDQLNVLHRKQICMITLLKPLIIKAVNSVLVY